MSKKSQQGPTGDLIDKIMNAHHSYTELHLSAIEAQILGDKMLGMIKALMDPKLADAARTQVLHDRALDEVMEDLEKKEGGA